MPYRRCFLPPAPPGAGKDGPSCIRQGGDCYVGTRSEFPHSLSWLQPGGCRPISGDCHGRHTAEVNQLRDEIARLEGDLSLLRMRSGDGASQEELEALQAENARLKAQVEELETQLTEPAATPIRDETNWKDEELAAYRRAETVERQARNRAAQMYHRVNGLIGRPGCPYGRQQGGDDRRRRGPGPGPGPAAAGSGRWAEYPHRGHRHFTCPGAGAPGRFRGKTIGRSITRHRKTQWVQPNPGCTHVVCLSRRLQAEQLHQHLGAQLHVLHGDILKPAVVVFSAGAQVGTGQALVRQPGAIGARPAPGR